MWSVRAACGQYYVPGSTVRTRLKKYRTDTQAVGRRGTKLWRPPSPTQDVALVANVQRNPFVSATGLKAATNLDLRLFGGLKMKYENGEPWWMM